MAAAVAEIEARERAIYERWFAGGAVVSAAPAEYAPRSPERTCGPDAVHPAGTPHHTACAPRLDSSILVQPEEPLHVSGTSGGGAANDVSAHGGGATSNGISGTCDVGAANGVSARDGNAAPDVSAEVVSDVLRHRNAFLAWRATGDACTAAAGGGGLDAALTFNPVATIEAVADAVIDDVIEAHVDELLAVCDGCVDDMYAAECAGGDLC